MAELRLGRGAICPVDLGRPHGHEQSGRRYAVVVQSPQLWALGTVIVVPTSTRVRPASFRPLITVDGQRTRALCEQIRVVDAGRLGEPAGWTSHDELSAIDDALTIVLDL